MNTSKDAQDDVELSGGMEHDAFIPGGQDIAKRRFKSESILTRYFPPQILSFLEILSRFKLMIIVLILFVLAMVWLGVDKNRSVRTKLSEETLALSKELVQNMSQTEIPEYVLTHAPLVFLDKGDKFHPSDIAAHISATHATQNFTVLKDAPDVLTLDNLDSLDALKGDGDVFLTSISPLIKHPSFLKGQAPNSKTLQTENARSCVIFSVEKGEGMVDAFYVYFYTFNEGPVVVGHELGDHLGDWEHNMIRFQHGVPQAVWYSQHDYGTAYTYTAVSKIGKRPIAYSAKGSHANYAAPGSHDLHKNHEEVPAHIVYDHTSHGPLWDPSLSAYYYTYSTESKQFTPVLKDTPLNYLYFEGRWGDQELGEEEDGQESFHGFKKWTSGPQGPLFKNLDRNDVCLPNRPECVINTSL